MISETMCGISSPGARKRFSVRPVLAWTPRMLTCISLLFAHTAVASAQCQYSATDLSLPDTSYPANSYNAGTTTFRATNSITAAGSAGTFTVSGGATVALQAGSSIDLKTGFDATAANGSSFDAQITPISAYQLTTIVSPAFTGTVTPAPCSSNGYYSAGTVVSLAANPGAGYHFVNWSTGSSLNPLNVTMSSGLTITANFAFGQVSGPITPSRLESNLGILPIDIYTTAQYTDIFPGATCHTVNGTTPQTCIQQFLANWRSQGVTGVRFQSALGNGQWQVNPNGSGPFYSSYSTPFTDEKDQNDHLIGGLNLEWNSNLRAFFADVKAAGITNITPYTVMNWYWSGWSNPTFETSAVLSDNCTNPPQDQLFYFYPWLPFGLIPD